MCQVCIKPLFLPVDSLHIHPVSLLLLLLSETRTRSVVTRYQIETVSPATEPRNNHKNRADLLDDFFTERNLSMD